MDLGLKEYQNRRGGIKLIILKLEVTKFMTAEILSCRKFEKVKSLVDVGEKMKIRLKKYKMYNKLVNK